MKCGILLAAFGSGSVQGESTLKLFDAEVRERFPHLPVRWAFTSGVLRGRLAAARKKSDSVRKALEKMWFEKYTHVAVQPLQIIPGNEYTELCAEVAVLQGPQCFTALGVGAPLLASDADVARAAAAIVQHLPPQRTAGEAVILMGHGARHRAVACYDALGQAVRLLDAAVYVGTMNGAVQLEHILPHLGTAAPESRVWLMPLLSVVGRHTLHDMAGTNPQSWRSRIEAAGFTCIPVLKGTAEYGGFITLWLDHLAHVVKQLDLGMISPSPNKNT
ncbi:MAG: sirohydrochlorin cobaltochelatase [Desulfovibrionaceae bacterium]